MPLRLLVCTLALFAATTARADQPRDFIARTPQMGNFLMVDVVFPAGIQVTGEHRRPIHGISNQLTLRANALAVWPYAMAGAGVDFRMLYVTVGFNGGVHHAYRDYNFADWELGTRGDRENRDHQGRFSRSPVLYGELKLALTMPLGDYVAISSTLRGRMEDRPRRSFDWLLTQIHDGGPLLVHDNILLFHGESWGGLGVQAQWVLSRDAGEMQFQVNPGILFVTRPGFRWRNDLFLVSILTHLPDDQVYGNHQLGLPVNLIIAYRTILEL